MFIRNSIGMSCACVCMNMTPMADPLCSGEARFRREARGERSQISVLTCMCVGCVCGPLPGEAAHTVKPYERCESPRGYHHFNNACIIQSKSIAVDPSGAARWSRGRKKRCVSLYSLEKSFNLWFLECIIHFYPESLLLINFSFFSFIFQKY